ncbi:polysaccharide biosynthesis protein [Aquibacillus albus]|uniref:FlaA1/EpsC-like NDP-sugar epimerase n=1 Tax=Aquibacillus albus TaxID=1168171 RepID=A0ABS2MZP0_9BACI|nr:nucleoside-diphosphate sugar epimerase/dehydratase [Aquibacillus albus]MBM7571371.1 FlaA1/EpsC-like NDP-sugar epimerase [Aquibacillus albus]
MSYHKRIIFLVGLDSLIVLFSIFIGYFILQPMYASNPYPTLLFSSLSLLVCHHAFAFRYKLYHKAWEYASVGELIAIVKAITFSVAATGVIQLIFMGAMYKRVLVLTWMLHILLIGGSRFSWRIIRDRFIKPNNSKKRTLIVGAGSAGTMLVRQLMKSNDSDIDPIAFVDDDLTKQKLEIYGVPVKGKTDEIVKIVENYNIKHIIIAIPSLSKSEIQAIYQQCSKTNAKTQIMPMIEDIVTGKVSVNSFREVEVEDLLGRDPVQLDTDSLKKKITEKTILVTGAGGSIGSEICRQVCKFHPKKIILLGHGENSIYQIDMELRQAYQQSFEIVPIIADVQDKTRILEVVDFHRPEVIYHAAAHKHVPLMEYNPKEAVKNNVIGTKNVAEAADIFGVETFVLVSSDKAVNPTNVMGSTKRIAEMVIQNLAKESNTKFVAVRFGNVLGSRGSVIPLFKKQIQAGGPVTVTDPEMTRYFMTIPEASRLVMQAGALARGGEIFVLDMGEPVKIVDLAENLIRLSGYTVDEIGIKFSGIRPGEKLFEELLSEKEVHPKPVYPKIFIGKSVEVEYDKVDNLVSNHMMFDQHYLKDYVVSLANNREMEVYGVVNS